MSYPTARLNTLCKAVNVGHVGPSSMHRQADGVPFIMGKDVGVGFIKTNDLDRVTPEFHRSQPKSQIRAGDIVVVRIGKSGQAAKVPETLGDANCSGLVIIKQPRIEPDFLVYFLNSPLGRSYSIAQTRGSTRPTLNTKSVAETFVPNPPLEEQRRIVAILDEAFAGLAIAAANAEKNLRNVQELFDSYLSSIFWQNGETQRLGDICDNLDSKRIPVTKRDRKSGDIPYYGASGVVDHVSDFIFDEDLLLVSEDGANLVMRTYPIAFSIAGKSWVNNHAHVLRFPELASQKFAEYYLNSISLMPYVNGMAQPKLNQKALNSISVPWPKLEERKRVVARLEELTAQTDRMRELYETRIAALRRLTQSILQKAFTGDLNSRPSQAIKEAAE